MSGHVARHFTPHFPPRKPHKAREGEDPAKVALLIANETGGLDQPAVSLAHRDEIDTLCYKYMAAPSP